MLRLLLGDLRVHWVRHGLAVAALALSVSLVVALTGGFASLQASARQVLGTYLGTVDVVVRPREERGVLIGKRVVSTFESDPRVRRFEPRLVTPSAVLDPQGKLFRHRPSRVIGRPPPSAEAPVITLAAGTWFKRMVGTEAVIDESLARRLKVEVGDRVTLPRPDSPLELTVVGIADKPDILRLEAPAIYVPLGTLQSWLGQPGRVGEIELDLAEGVDAEAFVAEWEAQHATDAATLWFETAGRRQADLDRNLQGMELFSFIGGMLGVMVAIFIVFSALSIGVAERSRTLAMLRAIGAVREQIVALVLAEGMLVSLAGVIVGVLLGWTWLHLLTWAFPEVFVAGAVMDMGSVVLAASVTLVAALVASAVPALAAARVSPLEAMAVVSRAPSSGRPWRLAIVGGLLLLVDPALVFLPGLDRGVRMWGHVGVGLACVMLGLLLLAPALVVIMERALGGTVAWVMRLEPGLLRQQLSGGLGRSAGTAAALMLGLLSLVVIQTHGRSLATGWSLPARFPDMLIVAPAGLEEAEVTRLEQLPQLRDGAVLPVGLVTPQLGSEMFALPGVIQMPNSTIVFGVDIDKAFGSEVDGSAGMVELDFVEGDAASARRLLRRGRHVVVAEDFKRVKGLGVGDSIRLKTAVAGEVDYIIAGVVRSMGLDVIVRIFDMRREFKQWTAAGVVTTLADLKRDFGVQRIHLLAANLGGEEGKSEAAVKEVKKQLGAWGLFGADSRRIKGMIDSVLGRLLDLVSSVALVALAIASLGVANMVIAGIRTRRWQFGVLRSMGLTRGGLLRLVLSEAVLLGLIASALGLLGGLILSVDANQLAASVMGYAVPLVVPVGVLAGGVVVTVAVSVLAGLWPALRASRADTLSLLKAGRTSA